MNRVAFLVDGFNLYHSVVDASYDLGGISTKWLNIHSLCRSYLPHIGRDTTIEKVYYFSALATHLLASDPSVVARHMDYIACLKPVGIEEQLARFKPKHIKCKVCSGTFKRYEEKETDVAIATRLLELFYFDRCDTAVLVTGDTDIAPAVKSAKTMFPNKKIVGLFPHKRRNEDLATLVDNSFRIKAMKYTQHQFPNPVVLSDGTQIYRPSTW